MDVKTPIEITAGWLEGHLIRRARKAKPCRHGIRVSGDPSSRCTNTIQPGDLYVEGELDTHGPAGGFAFLPYCLECMAVTTPEVQQAIKRAAEGSVEQC